jgi:amino acid adenylation domain-containing protein
MSGPLDLPALRAAIAAVVARHEALRTSFPDLEGQPEMVVADQLDLPLPVTDLSGQPEAERAATVAEYIQQWCEQPFDLATGPLVRTVVVQTGPQEHVLCLALHHIICDGQSLALLFDELGKFYALASGTDLDAALPPLAAQYRNYVDWHWTRPGGEEAIDWWRSYLADAPPLLTLPADRPRPSVRGTAGATTLFELSAELMAQVHELAGRKRMSPFMVLLSAYATLLSALSGATDLLIGVPVTDRPLAEFEPLIGLFVHNLPIRIRIPARQTFDQTLSIVRRSVLDVLAHQGVSFDQLVEELRPDRSLGHTPLVQVAFSADLSPFPQPSLAGLDVEISIPEPTTAKFDLDMSINEAPGGQGGFVCVLTYSTELFDPRSADRLIEQFVRLLTVAVTDPEQPITAEPLLSEAERTDLLGNWSSGGPGRAGDRLVHEMFASQVEATPTAPAVSADGHEISYAELDARAEAISRQLLKAGVGPDDLVGVLQQRGVDLVATLLGILKAGAGYLPLSSTHPPAYLAKLLTTAGARHVVTEPALAHRLAEADVSALIASELISAPATPGQVPAPVRPQPGNLAYVLFTSGSTGEPKGVAITHRSLSGVAATMREMYKLSPADRVLQFANIGFDITVEEIFPTLAAGACVVLSSEPPPDPAGLTALMTRERVTFTILTSSFWQYWVSQARSRGEHPAPTLRLISIGAEPVDAETLRYWQQATKVPAWNAYGLTETTVNTTLALLPDSSDSDLVTIGRPINGVDVYVLDPELTPVPVGVAGEVYAGGDCLARGYLARPDLTADRFVPHPWSAQPGARLLRTGDRARWLPDGNLEALGRLDEQLKIRGYRIEPGHVEAALRSHPDVSAAAAIVKPGPDGQDQLIGYVVPADGGDVPADLRTHLAGRLPAYLTPSALIAIPAIPRNANGKIDMRALPEPAAAQTAKVAARSDTERLIADIWQQVLEVPTVGIYDNFFDTGGTSMTLAALLARLNQALDRSLPLVALYEYPTIAALAAHLAGGDAVDRTAGPGSDRAGQSRAEQLRAGRARLAGRRADRT